jgi:threonine/homoserine/homoserine lactone efflux protein
VVLIWLGIQSLRRGGKELPATREQRAFRDGLVTSLANPKLAVFFIALFPQFVGARGNVLPTTLAMAAMIVCGDFIWYSALAFLASRAKAGFMRSRAGRWLERTTGGVLIALGLRIALTGGHARL